MPDYDAYPDEIQDALASFESDVDALMGRLEMGKISESQWRESFAALLASYIALSYLIGSGAQSLTGDAGIWVTNWLASQLDYLNNFLAAIQVNRAAGGGWTPGYNARARMYVTSIVAPFWYGETEGLPLPALPGDGSSDCGQNDACGWDIHWIDREKGDADCYWLLNQQRIVVEHCQQCIERARQWKPLKVRNWRLVLPPVSKEKRSLA